jgi:small glutamine-rich tetratricopeptide repeat-containing protein alpha
MADDKQKHLVFAILEFLQTSINNGTIKQDDAEGIEGTLCFNLPSGNH